MSIAELQHAAADLSERDRAVLALWLLESLPPHSGEDASWESVAEAVRRRGELTAGKARPLSADEFWASIDGERPAWK